MSDFFDGANVYLYDNGIDEASNWKASEKRAVSGAASAAPKKILRIVTSPGANEWLKHHENVDVVAEFKSLVKKLDRRLGPASLLSERLFSPEYAAIIGLGPRVVPVILKELQKSVQPWFWALKALTREDPAKDLNPGDFGGMAAAWVEWGKRNKLV